VLFGKTSLFAVECEVKAVTADGWILGGFRFWIDGIPVGDWDDLADLKGIASWMCDFAYNYVNRREPLLEGLSKEIIFRFLYESVIDGPPQSESQLFPLEDVYSRFHISHLGMSSFDKVGMLLVENLSGQRVLWRFSDNEIQEKLLPSNEMQRVSKEFCEWFELYKQKV
jgi:hypothetical protein